MSTPEPIDHAARLRALASSGVGADWHEIGRAEHQAIRWAVAELDRLRAEVARSPPPGPPPSVFEREQATYRAMLPHLLTTLNADGQYVIIKGETCLGVERTYDEALALGYRTCGPGRFMVKQVVADGTGER